MIDLIPNPNQGPRNGVVLRVALGNTVKQDDGRTKICGAKTSDISTYAAVFNPTRPELPTDLQKKYQLADAIIFFCDAFFTELEDDSTLLSQSPMLDRLRARGTQHILFSRLNQSRLINWHRPNRPSRMDTFRVDRRYKQ